MSGLTCQEAEWVSVAVKLVFGRGSLRISAGTKDILTFSMVFLITSKANARDDQLNRYNPVNFQFLAYFPYFDKIKVGLWCHLAVCVYVSLYPTLLEWLNKSL
jgi:hypothetical protein